MPGVLQSWGLQRVRHDLATEQQQTNKCRDWHVLHPRTNRYAKSWIREKTVHGNSDTILDWARTHGLPQSSEAAWNSYPCCQILAKPDILPRDRCHVDHNEPPVVAKRLHFVLTTVETFYGFVLAIPKHSTDSGHRVQALKDHFCFLLGFPKSRVLVTQSCLTLCNAMDCSQPGSSVYGVLHSKNTRVGCYFLLQGFFPTQGSNQCLLHCRLILYCLSHQGSPKSPRSKSISLFKHSRRGSQVPASLTLRLL